MRRILSQVFGLAWRAVSGPRAWVGIVVYAMALGLQFFGVWISVRFIAWNKDFYDAIEQRDLSTTVEQVWVFFGLVALSAGSYLIGKWLRDKLDIHWRERLTNKALDVWMANGAYWHLRPGASPQSVDNPDQRVAEDCRNFVNKFIEQTLDLIGSSVALISYIAILWSLSDYTLRFSIAGVDIALPRYIMWAAFVHVAVSTFATHMLGWPLKQLVFRQERHEADFRYSLIQIRDSAGEIAQSGGESAERRRLNDRFSAIRANWNRLIGREFILGLFVRPYFQSILRVPILYALPAYFGGNTSFGGLMQLSAAFGRVTQTLSWFIFEYRELAELAAVTERLDNLFVSAGDPPPMPDTERAISRSQSPDAALHVRSLHLSTPQGRSLLPVPDRSIMPGDRVWISGASGQGKSTLLAAISGIWLYGRGEIQKPEGSFVYLPQKPHLNGHDIHEAATYPRDPADFDRDEIGRVLVRLGLGHRLDAARDNPGALEGLSAGERQRLALARVLLLRPDWIVLDEATSALDTAAEESILGMVRRELPGSAILCVSHRAPEALAPFQIWNIGENHQDTGELRVRAN